MKLTFPSNEAMQSRRFFSRWDFVAIPLLLVGIYLFTIAFRGASVPFTAQTPDLTVSLDPINLPYYGLRSLFRMFLAVLCSLFFTLTYATIAAKSRRAEKIMIPVLDFFQSLPILGFLTVTTVIFLGLFQGSLLGLEAASIFAIFTSQAWNMTFSFYHSLVTVPKELNEAARVLRLSPWQKFWRLEVPFATPSLVWNMMMSVSGGWFFVVASEVISVVGRPHAQALPGIGAYIGRAIQEANISAMAAAAVTLLILILIYDQLIFRPIVAWAEKFKFEQSVSEVSAQSWMLTLLQRAHLVQRVAALPATFLDHVSLMTSLRDRPGKPLEATSQAKPNHVLDWIWNALIAVVSLSLLFILARFMFGPSLGVAHGQILAPNTNLNTMLDVQIARRFRAAGVFVGADQTVYLSSVCAASHNGTHLSPALRQALSSKGVTAPSDLPVECAKPMVMAGNVALPEIGNVILLGIFTMLRVVVLIILATLFWTPIGVWIGLRPRIAQAVQPLAQFAAAFPSNLLFPIAVVLIAHFALNPNIWTSPLMILGTQWYILFNVIAGTVSIPNDLKEAARVTGVRGWTWWRTLIIPSIFPAFITGGITASGGAWNASIVAEIVSWGSTTLVATGLGAYIAQWSTGEFNPHIALGMMTMGMFVLTFNRLIWRRLYGLAEERFRLD